MAEEDPLSAGGDPLSGSLASDPLTAALIDPLASGPNTTSGGIFETSKVIPFFDAQSSSCVLGWRIISTIR